MPGAVPDSGTYAGALRAWPEQAWLTAVVARAERVMADPRHGDWARWQQALAELPRVASLVQLDQDAPRLGGDAPDPESLRATLMQLHPWRKGPLQLAGVTVDTEWRSDWKWRRLASSVELAGARVLDIGCGNGYFGWRMLAAGARLVIGIDPTLVFVMQWLACRQLAGQALDNYVLPLRAEDLPQGEAGFDAVFSMGVLYHRREPLQHLRQLRRWVRPGGQLVLETLVLPEDQPDGLMEPGARYARMRNVWAIPGSERLRTWLEESGWREVRVVDVTATTVKEQRSTDWMRFESLPEALQPGNPKRTVEGHPAPLRAVLVARR